MTTNITTNTTAAITNTTNTVAANANANTPLQLARRLVVNPALKCQNCGSRRLFWVETAKGHKCLNCGLGVEDVFLRPVATDTRAVLALIDSVTEEVRETWRADDGGLTTAASQTLDHSLWYRQRVAGNRPLEIVQAGRNEDLSGLESEVQEACLVWAYKKARRQVEDRLRKDDTFLLNCLGLAGADGPAIVVMADGTRKFESAEFEEGTPEYKALLGLFHDPEARHLGAEPRAQVQIKHLYDANRRKESFLLRAYLQPEVDVEIESQKSRMVFGTGWLNHILAVRLGYCKCNHLCPEWADERTKEALSEAYTANDSTPGTPFGFCTISRTHDEDGFGRGFLVTGPDGATAEVVTGP